MNKFLFNDVKRINKFLLFIICVGIFSSITLSSYALFTNDISGQNNLNISVSSPGIIRVRIYKDNSKSDVSSLSKQENKIYFDVASGYILDSFTCTTGTSSYDKKSNILTITNATDNGVCTLNYKGDANLDTSGANHPNLPSNMIAVYYDSSASVWKKADSTNKNKDYQWYDYKNKMWANAVTVTSATINHYQTASMGTQISIEDITTMFVWIPRFNAEIPYNYNNGTKDAPGAIDVNFKDVNQRALDAFTFEDKNLSGFWFGKFELAHKTLSNSTTDNNLACSNETCSNANDLLIKPSIKSLRYNNNDDFFYAVRSMQMANNSFGFDSLVNIHVMKNSEWGAVAYLTHSKYGRCTNNICERMGTNNNSSFLTGYGAPIGSNPDTNNGPYNTIAGMKASTTGNITGVYDMVGGANEYTMGIYNGDTYNPLFNETLKIRYYDNYTGNSYQGHAMSETDGWYDLPCKISVKSDVQVYLKRSSAYSTDGSLFSCAFGLSYGQYDSSRVSITY